MVTRNRNRLSNIVGVVSSLIGFISLIFCCVGVGLPSWYQGKNANQTILYAEANLFYSCFLPNATLDWLSNSYKCTSYNSFTCSTTSYLSSILNQTSYISGCINPTSGSSLYLTYDQPIYQILLDDYYRLRSSAILSIISILFIFFSIISSLSIGFVVLRAHVLYIAPIIALLSIIFGISCLVVAGSVLKYTGAGFALFVVGILLETIVVLLLSILSGYLNGSNQFDQRTLKQPVRSPIFIQRVRKRRI